MSAKCKYQKSKPKSKFKNIFNFRFWSLSLVLHFALCTLILFFTSYQLFTFFIFYFDF